jgi:hypothetical protein
MKRLVSCRYDTVGSAPAGAAGETAARQGNRHEPADERSPELSRTSVIGNADFRLPPEMQMPVNDLAPAKSAPSGNERPPPHHRVIESSGYSPKHSADGV